jgi:sirohydrochlorin ferrochelatase
MPSRQPDGPLPSRQYGSDFPSRQAFPVRQPAARPPRPAGRHRRPVPASLPETAPALVLAVPGADSDLTSSPVADLAAVLRVDNPAVDVRIARVDDAGRGDPAGIRSVLADAAAHRPGGATSAVVIPLLASPHAVVNRKLREAVAAAEGNAIISGFINSNALIAEALHIRLAEAGLARADRVRLFSIVTAADGIIIATVGGPEAAMGANVTSVLLAARLALPVITASMDSQPSIQEGAMRLKEMGVNRLAIAPCFIGPEATQSDIDNLAIGAECAAPIGAHSNIAKLAAVTYGQVISQMEFPGEQRPE